MTDSVTNLEIEDVLSSIRRLVSADQREAVNAEDEAPAENKLLLSPALRVDHDSAVEKVDQEQDEITHVSVEEPNDNDTYTIPLAFIHSRKEDIVYAEGELFVDETRLGTPAKVTEDEIIMQHLHEDITVNDADNNDLDAVTLEAPDETAAALPDADITATEDFAPDEIYSGSVVSLENKIAGFEAAVADRQDQWEPDEPSDDAYSGTMVASLSWVDPDANADADLISMDAPETSKVQDTSEIEEVVQYYEAPDPEDTLHSLQQNASDEMAPEQSAADVTDTVDQAATTAEETSWYVPEAELDEAALRDMVGDIVRQELQGALGERITRNVRKLVRKEIHRALINQDID